MFPSPHNDKRYNSYDSFLKNKFGSKVAKIPLNLGLSCPNIDGTKGYGGCTFCSSYGSGEFAGNSKLPLDKQFENVKNIMDRKWKNLKYIAYFQPHTNTYAPVDFIERACESVLSIPNVVGISISTRPDCITHEMVRYLEKLSKITYLTIELGLQSIHERTTNYINRCHSFSEFLDTYRLLRETKINIAIHIINGLPFETKSMMLETAKEISKLNPHLLKIHMLHILKNTKILHQFRHDNFRILSLEEYVEIVCDQLEILPHSVVIGRLTGDAKKNDLVQPEWSLKKFVILNEIDKVFTQRNTYQGYYHDK